MEQFPESAAVPLLDRVIDGFEGSGVEINAKGVEVLASAKRVPVAGWMAVALLPTDEAFAPIREMQQRMLLATLVLTLVAGLLTVWLPAVSFLPLRFAAGMLADMRDARKPLQALPVVRSDEIGQLAPRFQRSAENTRATRDAASADP